MVEFDEHQKVRESIPMTEEKVYLNVANHFPPDSRAAKSFNIAVASLI